MIFLNPGNHLPVCAKIIIKTLEKALSYGQS